MQIPWTPTAYVLPTRADFDAAAWDFDKLLQHSSHLELRLVLGAVRKIVHHPVLENALAEILTMTRIEFKTYSNTGFVVRGGKTRDLGNYEYTLLFQFVHRMAEHYKLKNVSDKVAALSAAYPSLARKHVCSQHSMSMKGDVLETALADCRHTGPNVPEQVRRERQEFNDLMEEFSASMEEVYFRLCGRRKPALKTLPCPDLLFKALTLANAIVVEKCPKQKQLYEKQYKVLAEEALRTIGTLVHARGIA